ncbi:MAG: tetratricopeptide repeat protein, partial [Acidobacteriota bacterium]
YDFLYRVYMKKKDRKNVMKILSEAIRILPNATPFRLSYITRLSELGLNDEVISNCNDLIEIDPLFTRGYIVLGETYEKLGEKEKSYKNFRKALELEPENVSLQIKFSEKLLGEQKFQEVLKVYDTLLGFEDVRKNTDLLFKIALFNTKYGSMAKSGEILAEIVRKKPGGKYYYYYAMILARLGDRVNALRNMQIALSRYSGDLTNEQISTAKQTIDALR